MENMIIYINKYKYIKQIKFVKGQIRKFLSPKKNQKKLFHRPDQSKSKKNYLFLNNSDKEENWNKELYQNYNNNVDNNEINENNNDNENN